MTLQERVEALLQLGTYLLESPSDLEVATRQAFLHNRWFSIENTTIAIESVARHFLSADNLKDWIATYPISDDITPQRVGIIMAGNIPMVGFHDMLCVFVAGHHAKIKLSDKDKILIPFCIKALSEIDERTAVYFEQVDRMKEIDVIIATGSNNSARYFKTYFGKYPNIIRKSRNGVAVLHGNESEEQLHELGKDIFTHFGLGCRNVSKFYVPRGYDFNNLYRMLLSYESVNHHNKYKNNYDYNLTILILNQVKHTQTSCVLLIESEVIASKIAELYYEYYDDVATLENSLSSRLEEIQCIVSEKKLNNLKTFPLGYAQRPSLSDYADGVDTMAFLVAL